MSELEESKSSSDSALVKVQQDRLAFEKECFKSTLDFQKIQLDHSARQADLDRELQMQKLKVEEKKLELDAQKSDHLFQFLLQQISKNQ